MKQLDKYLGSHQSGEIRTILITDDSAERTGVYEHHLCQDHRHVGHKLSDDDLGFLGGFSQTADDDRPCAVLILSPVVIFKVDVGPCGFLYLQLKNKNMYVFEISIL